MKIHIKIIQHCLVLITAFVLLSCNTASEAGQNENKTQSEGVPESTNISEDMDSATPNDAPQNITDATANFFEDANSFLKKNVRNGKVDYKGIANDKSDLNTLVEAIAKMDLKNKSTDEYKAFWFNAYNILTIKGIVDNYPIKQPTDVDGFFKKIKYTAAGEKVTLDDIENKKVRAKLNDARIHFVLVCGAQSCPPIIDQAYTPQNVNALLEKQTRKAANSDYFVTVDKGSKTTNVSMIMKWYKEDFVKGKQDEIAFLNKYRNDKIPADYTIAYKDYNWDLNKQ